MKRVKNKVAIVTGGASGLGKSSAKLLAREGAKIVVSDIDEEGGKKVVQQIKEDGGEAIFIKQDVAKEDEWKNVIETTLETYGKLHILANSAGIGLGGTVEDVTLEDWKNLIDINLNGTFLGTKYGIKGMRKTDEGGSIINFSSIEGLIGDPNLPAYNASKGGVTIFTKSAALHCAKQGYGIRINSIHPAYIWTPMVENFLKAQGDVEEGKKQLESLHPIGHLGEPDDIGYGVVYLASDESKFMTGSELVIDGGYTAQ
ncbi:MULTISPECIES: SDR family oxidoreductase [Flavobacteriaceae]|jgi:NAD(P)-dependent dehydrogenase (short-subunit alcohol dehydrogenase family)|uniref:Short-chain dehydrogenase/reductase SDR n=3 Tax=Flavobacteriaceae TaxID=49546 RepID=A3XKE6_LEEBM|nr:MULTISPECIES: SDR family oxidoreductase [Flavobacteriaceae]HBR53491.1 3-oxoacyl-ACP reductase [Flavobacteriaceae bacterium]HNP67704.1 SDR family oxidoreductase [Aequorivita sp.]EAQ49976.1 Short-chain dehydrogenase/reductase SDR [Leeuwenhoekiella blandensis MED217]MAO43158.1 3-oxoacyl-ACP reductase [Leeuwenhoekiella sp.]MBW8201530.1 glucose 1-dehydrogenase [Allomuricauda abyssi]|tara:strand:- start:1133 stop:1906 length:774 start_codon:yes stop_codon:yes gene_type:complete